MAIHVRARASVGPASRPLPQPRLRELLGKRATGFINWRRKRQLIHRGDVLARIVADLKAQAPDHIAVTGDLVNISLAGEYPPARAWLASLGPPARRHLGARQSRRLCARGRAAIRSSTGATTCAATMPAETAFPFVRRRGPLALIGLSTAVPTAPFMATGRLGGEQLARLAETLDRCGREGLFRVVLIHHPPISTPARHFKRLVDGADFRAVLARHGAELVIHGHDHEHSLIELKDRSAASRSWACLRRRKRRRASMIRPATISTDRRPRRRWCCEAIARGLARQGDAVVEIRRTMLVNERVIS